jgi:general secretion pathway protein G
MHTVSRKAPLTRRGFTLIELLTVIAILSILIAFLVPAVMNARRSALVVQVTTDITTLDNAIKSFKNEFGVEPPSTITLYETGTGWNGTGPATVTSRAIISRIWPQFNFAMDRDINDDGNTTGTFTLNGSECLVFFLGGVSKWNDTNGNSTRDASDDTWIPSGFSRNPANPFDQAGTNRLSIFNDIRSDRLIASPTNTHFFTYADPISGTQVPYLYANSNEGQGYNESGPALPHTALDFPSGTLRYYYRQGSEPTDPTVSAFTTPFWNKNGYQIVSAGFDRKFGLGGPYAVQSGQKELPIFGGITAADREAERDNITNFSNGLLVP